MTRAKRKPVSQHAELEATLGYRFKRPELLTLALTHRSFVYDGGGSDGKPVAIAAGEDLADPARDNEQYEFIGDAALGLLAAESLCRRFPASREGELTRLRASVVSRRFLAAVGTRLGLGAWLRLGHTAEKNDGRHSAALAANAVEAVLAAIYLDGGLEPARHFVETEIIGPALPELEASMAAPGATFSGAVGDHKSSLQELLQAAGRPRPEYRLVAESGPDHRRIFHVEVRLLGEDKALAAAEGGTKKQAQQEAARMAVETLRKAAHA